MAAALIQKSTGGSGLPSRNDEAYPVNHGKNKPDVAEISVGGSFMVKWYRWAQLAQTWSGRSKSSLYLSKDCEAKVG